MELLALQRVRRLPPHLFFVASAVFHYLGPAFAVLLFARLSVPGVVLLRIGSAAAVFAICKRPLALLSELDRESARLLVAFAAVLAAMNTVFYYAIAALPLATVGAIEFLGPITLAAIGVRSLRNVAALVLAISGAALLTKARFPGQLGPYVFAFTNCLFFSLYIVLGHRLSRNRRAPGISLLAAAMCIASLIVAPFGGYEVTKVLHDPALLFAGIGVGVCSSVLPYVFDQLAMARLPRASFALFLSLLPATATVIGIIILRQVPSEREIIGVALVIAGIAAHQPPDSQEPEKRL
jgi:inner membrane transporter RhtA